MAIIGYHASHEQFSPSELLSYVKAAEDAGFQAAMCSDHFYPWSERQGQSGYAWSWLGAALQATTLTFGVVNAPGQRYHPAIIAQAAATLAEMYPNRFWVAVGSGEALSERITGERWPPKAKRNERLEECAEVMRALWAGEEVTHYGLIVVEQARLYTRPATPPMLIGAAITAETAGWLGGWADGLITVNQRREKLERVIKSFRDGGGQGKPVYLQVHLSYDQDKESALQGAHEQWRSNAFTSDVLANLHLPRLFDEASQALRPEDITEHVRVSADLGQQRAWLEEDVAMGFDRIYLHNANRQQMRFIEDFGARVLPELGA